jgi:hypothetical protein
MVRAVSEAGVADVVVERVAHGARDLAIPLMLTTSANVVVASMLWIAWDFSDLPGAAALAAMTALALPLVVTPIQIATSLRESQA